MLVFGNPACHPRPIRASQVFLLEVNIKDVGYIGWGWGFRSSGGWAEIVLQKQRQTGRRRESEREGPGSIKQGRVSRFKGGFSHYDSATVYCILQRPYYNGLLAFMLPFTSQVQHLHGKQGQDLQWEELAEDHNARAEDLGKWILSEWAVTWNEF